MGRTWRCLIWKLLKLSSRFMSSHATASTEIEYLGLFRLFSLPPRLPSLGNRSIQEARAFPGHSFSCNPVTLLFTFSRTSLSPNVTMNRTILLLLSYLQLGAGETVLGVYIFHCHGDRTSKSSTPVLLTSEGVNQSHSSGVWYRNRYVGDNAPSKIHGISSNTVDLSQIFVTGPVDNVLQSAQAFLQGLYPPARNMSLEQSAGDDAILDGYQFIPVNIEGSSANDVSAEENMRLQSASACPNAIASIQSYLESSDYLTMLRNTKDFYQALLPVYEDTFPRDEASFERAYASTCCRHGKSIVVSQTQHTTANITPQSMTSSMFPPSTTTHPRSLTLRF